MWPYVVGLVVSVVWTLKSKALWSLNISGNTRSMTQHHIWYNLTPHLLCPIGWSSQYTLNRWLCGPQNGVDVLEMGIKPQYFVSQSIICLVCFVASFKLSFVWLLLVDRMYCYSCLVCVVILGVFVVLCGHCCFFTVDSGLLATSQYSEGPATGHLDTGFSWFPTV